MGKQKEFSGTVISAKMQKTVIVRVMRMAKHIKYSRIIRRFNKFKVHDEKGSAKVGDIVRIRQSRPMSKDKRFRLIGIVKQAVLPEVTIKEE